MFLTSVIDQTFKKIKVQTANIITLTNLFLGGFAIIEGLKSNFSLSVLLIFIAALTDRFDGMIARKLKIESQFGKQLDSMSDIISFGVAPGLLIYQGILIDFEIPATFFTIFYIACGASRLARFNLTNDHSHFIGLPITAAGCLLTFSFLFSSQIPSAFYIVILIMLSILMVSPFKLKKI